MDVTFLNMMIAKEYIFRFKHSCLAHTREILNHPREEQAANGPNIPSNLEAQHEEAGNDQDVGDRVVSDVCEPATEAFLQARAASDLHNTQPRRVSTHGKK